MASLRVLVIDDDVDLADGLSDVIELLGHEVETAYSGEEGLIKAANGRFDVALIDVSLPGRSGIECARELNATQSHLRCLLMTGYGVDWLARNGFDQVETTILTKPVSMEKIIALLSDFSAS